MNTVEGAMVLSALTVTTGLLVSGVATLATAASARTLARDGARAAALGGDAGRWVTQRRADARVEVSQQETLKGSGLQTISVRVTLPAPLADVSANTEIVAEPPVEGEGP
ncbi:hypothetical protein [Corynebacterium heidelbergense]|uniref:TadE-like protein n=1 Tax=Corynebacterium heidelbergense TaxID=2055947 RepID=A0A364VA29_9CORY|nr:hypothetical protein [Corynebacterium heidelbergense]RAV33477.1 hypothetical protein CWC39_08280 [Corynebacterium heidelbergense]WCZ37472.1 hypothetical protein CHEID_09735 [Corynebacterium heidelbergense]